MQNSTQDDESFVAPWRTIQFIPDEPLEYLDSEQGDFDSNDAARGEALADQLARQLTNFILTRNSEAPNPPRIGILGGLGQGKTTVIHWALAKTEQNYFNHYYDSLKSTKKWRQSLSVEWFETASYKSDELEHELDRLLGNNLKAKLRSLFAYFSILLTLIIIGIFLFSFSVELLESQGKALVLREKLPEPKTLMMLISLLGGGTFIAYILKPWGYWWRSGQRKMNLGSKIWWVQGFRLLLGCTQILIIDDLDRANLDQQRAILRSLYKHQDQLAYAIVIGYDETQLLASRPKPESPRELLHKSINVEARMPVRVLTDTLRLAWMASSHAAILNPKLSFLNNPRAVGALARIMELLSPIQAISPRVAKHMVNNGLFFLAHVQKHDQPVLDDWCAVLRLLSLYIVLPQLRSQGDALRAALQSNQVDGLIPVTSSVIDIDNNTEITQTVTLAQILFNATRPYNPANLDWSPWVVLWSVRAFNMEAQINVNNQQQGGDVLKIPDFDSVNFLSDGLHRLIKGKPHVGLASMTDLLSAITSSDETDEIPQVIAQALLPLTGLMVTQLKTDTDRQRLLTMLWVATNEGILDWIFTQTDKGDFLVCLSEWMLTEERPWPISTQEIFSAWWQYLSKPDLKISSARRIRLLSLLPASSFHLADILAYAALAKNHIQHDLGPETWLVSYTSTTQNHSKLTFSDNPSKQFLDNYIGPESVKRYWPPLQVCNADFVDLLAEHCDAWRQLKLRGDLQLTPLEFLLFEDSAFASWLQSGQSENVLTALGKLFLKDNLWSEKTWLDLLIFKVNTNLTSTTQDSLDSPLKTLRKLKLRFLPLLQNPAINQHRLYVQILLAATFPNKQAFNKLAQKLMCPLPEQIAKIVIKNIRWWVAFSANAWHKKNPEQQIEIYKETIIQSWVAGLQPDTWDKVLVNIKVPTEWENLHTARWHDELK